MITLSELIRMLKKYAKNPSISDEDFLNEFLAPYVKAGSIKNKYGELFYLDKSRTSEIMARKIDVPKSLREARSFSNIESKTVENMSSFIERFIDEVRIREITGKLIEYIDEEEKNTIGPIAESKDCLNLDILLTTILLSSISTDNSLEAKELVLWKRGPDQVSVIKGDLFKFSSNNRRKKKNIVVIPVNTTFDTCITKSLEGESRPLVSENTLHGKWLIRMKKNNEDLSLLSERIRNSLETVGISPIRELNDTNGKRACYPIGTTAIIGTEYATFFLTAISEFDGINNAQGTPEDIETAVHSLSETYDKYGQGYDLYMPLIGTGRSRTGLSLKEAYDLIVRELKNNKNKIHGCIHLVIRPEDWNEIMEGEKENDVQN